MVLLKSLFITRAMLLSRLLEKPTLLLYRSGPYVSKASHSSTTLGKRISLHDTVNNAYVAPGLECDLSTPLSMYGMSTQVIVVDFLRQSAPMVGKGKC